MKVKHFQMLLEITVKDDYQFKSTDTQFKYIHDAVHDALGQNEGSYFGVEIVAFRASKVKEIREYRRLTDEELEDIGHSQHNHMGVTNS